MSIKNSNDTIGNLTRDFRLVAQGESVCHSEIWGTYLLGLLSSLPNSVYLPSSCSDRSNPEIRVPSTELRKCQRG
jgi:hypothetical protein